MADGEDDDGYDFAASPQTAFVGMALLNGFAEALLEARKLLGPDRATEFDELCQRVVNVVHNTPIEGLGVDDEAYVLRIAVAFTNGAVGRARGLKLD